MLNRPLSLTLRTTRKHLDRLKGLGVQTVKDFLLYFPWRYADESEFCQISEMKINEINVVQGRISNLFARRTRTGKFMIQAIIEDGTGKLPVTWFNQIYLMRLLREGDSVIVSGKLKLIGRRLSFTSPKIEHLKKEQIHTGRLVPIYHETEGISSKWIREKLKPLLDAARNFEDYMPKEILEEERLIPYSEAVTNVHFPENEDLLKKAQMRLAFDELFLLQFRALQKKLEWQKIGMDEQKQIVMNTKFVQGFVDKLPFKLTNAQNRCLAEILQDMAKPFPMSRLLEGDVGSGKTVVAAAAILHATKAGYQALMMAPTEILAKQHYQNFYKLLNPFSLNIQFLAGSTIESQKQNIIQQMKTGTLDIVIGTHALIQDRIGFKRLGIAVIDEQHRFGVKQREILKSYGSPHLLSMTATPIPRTLALTIYGDQDISILDEMPAGRQEIVTRIVSEAKRNDAYKWVYEQVRKGRQVFVICPLIEGSQVEEMADIKAATEEFERLSKHVFPDLRLALLHGRMKQNDKDAVMEKFASGELDILVSTSVVEVGIDVPNATIIIIEGAERFGLAQLHQFRGRVGRSKHQSYCFLFQSSDSENAQKRLLSMTQYSNGFKLAEIDLELRGPGEVYGIRQSGIPDLKMASLTDAVLVSRARTQAEKFLQKDPELKNHPSLALQISKLENIAIDY